MNIDVLKKISHGLNKLNCTWGVGGSVLLNQYNLVEKPKDIDILIDSSDTHKIKSFMSTIGQPINLPSKAPFLTRDFFGYNVDGVIIEFMGDFKIDLGNNNIYEFILDRKSIVHDKTIDSINIKFTTLEDWIVAYSVMNDPKNRIPLIKNYFENHGISYRHLLERNLNQNLRIDTLELISSLLNM
ncbi:hypothetical protein [[Clostridium] dakarense]|uniref:hypothetical protein n=1 Tax=Faecalimicrobium dakarense TaxID=1301100 RepID=UPI0004B29AC4|nr:hypothetical protein [[Clostridium] dakarense]